MASSFIHVSSSSDALFILYGSPLLLRVDYHRWKKSLVDPESGLLKNLTRKIALDSIGFLHESKGNTLRLRGYGLSIQAKFRTNREYVFLVEFFEKLSSGSKRLFYPVTPADWRKVRSSKAFLNDKLLLPYLGRT